jgi:hypothetical protein
LAKYSIDVPRPKAKRMLGSGVLIIRYGSNWTGFHTRKETVGDATTYTFSLHSAYKYAYDTDVMDGEEFYLSLEFSHNGRYEYYMPVPTKLED